MIRLRKRDGTLIDTAEVAAIEICSTDGKIAQLIVQSGERILKFGPKDKELQDWCKTVGSEVAEEIRIKN